MAHLGHDTSLMPVRGPLPAFRRRRRSFQALNQFIAPAFTAFLILSMLVVTVLIAWEIPGWFAAARSISDVKERLTLENEILKNLVQIVGGAFVIAGVYFTWRNTYLAKESQITDRFNKAIDHLGDEKLEIRLGGIYALGRIAKDSPKDHWPVMQVFCAFVRNRAANRPEEKSDLATDLQAVLSVLADRRTEYETDDQCLDLTGTDLRWADLKGAQFDRAHFDDSDLRGTDFMRASLHRADFRGADLREAHLREAHLDGANLISADLRNASLRLASLRNANLFGAKLQGSTLVGADLTNAMYVVRGQIEEAIVDADTRMPQLLVVTATDSK